MSIKSSQPRKQRKFLYEAPLHKRQKMVVATLDKKLREKFNRRNLPIRKGDKVMIMRGDYKGIVGTVREVDLKKMRIYIEEVKRKKVDGTEVHVPINPSNVKIIEPDMSDKKRQKLVERVKGEIEAKLKKEKKVEEKKEEKKVEKGFKCPICGKTFENKKDLNLHESREHKEYTAGE